MNPGPSREWNSVTRRSEDMCRLYEFRSSTPRKVECELIRSQNSLLSQSRRDARGLANPHGWGLATFCRAEPDVVRQAEAASDSADFRWEAARIHSRNVLAHVRRATIGRTDVANTHPFAHGGWTLAHNGNLGAFEALRPRLLDEMGKLHANSVRGDTDSEHVFHWLLSRVETEPGESTADVVSRSLRVLRAWSIEADPSAEFALNIILTSVDRTIGCRIGRSLFFVERRSVHPCEVCAGEIHLQPGESAESYGAVVVASEKVTSDEGWSAVPDESVFEIGPDLKMRHWPL